MKLRILLSALSATFIIYTSNVMADKPETEMEKFSYAIGFQIGQGLKRDGLEVDVETLSTAINDVLGNKELQVSVVDMRSVMASMQQKMQAQRQEIASKAQADGEAFLAANKGKEGVITLESGVQYKIIKTGSGKQPKATDSITAHYQGTLINGNVFDSSIQRNEPATFNVNQVIQGWQEVLQLMHEGDMWQIFIPSGLAYGENGAGPNIGPNEALVFDIELISVN